MARSRLAVFALAGVLATTAAGCGGSRHDSTATTATTATTTVGSTTTSTGPHATVWLCYPGHAPDPCATSLATTSVDASGKAAVQHLPPAGAPPIDCFYVYPTVSQEPTGNADLQIQLPEVFVAQVQAAYFSRVCRVFAPMYRQITTAGLDDPKLHANPYLAYGDVLAAWRDYLAHDNHGRGVVLIGHSQGAYVLKHLVKTVVDRSTAQRHLLVSAILLGGQVKAADTPNGRGGDFQHVPPCTSATQTGCLVAYSSFGTTPPPNARFGRDATPGTHIVCVDPAALAGGVAPVTPLFPALMLRVLRGTLTAKVTTPWVAFPGQYTSECKRDGTASWLQITSTHVPGDRRPVVRPFTGAGWGLHGTDVNIALTELVRLVGSQSRAYMNR